MSQTPRSPLVGIGHGGDPSKLSLFYRLYEQQDLPLSAHLDLVKTTAAPAVILSPFIDPSGNLANVYYLTTHVQPNPTSGREFR